MLVQVCASIKQQITYLQCWSCAHACPYPDGTHTACAHMYCANGTNLICKADLEVSHEGACLVLPASASSSTLGQDSPNGVLLHHQLSCLCLFQHLYQCVHCTSTMFNSHSGSLLCCSRQAADRRQTSSRQAGQSKVLKGDDLQDAKYHKCSVNVHTQSGVMLAQHLRRSDQASETTERGACPCASSLNSFVASRSHAALRLQPHYLVDNTCSPVGLACDLRICSAFMCHLSALIRRISRWLTCRVSNSTDSADLSI